MSEPEMRVVDSEALEDTVESRVIDRRARFRQALGGIVERGRRAELTTMLILPCVASIVGGFLFIFLGWYGAARSPRQIEQLPYVISGGMAGVALVFLGGILLASLFWVVQFQRMREQMEERWQRQLEAVQERLREVTDAAPASGTSAKKRTRRAR